ncbi:hypothetical protein DPMN_021385 [Dreissena polymorpha]|uniref:Uncharacterized protein n=1 Tax=Dreissena polymorpha TaxID=45954 RepID=A0A9D4NKN6_DREPO|nr:hypothetical protein DPMN_021385 [Dreissena polymorpha]
MRISGYFHPMMQVKGRKKRYALRNAFFLYAREGSFTILSLVNNYLRNTTSQKRLTALGLLSIECQVLRELDFTQLIDDIGQLKCRKRDV